MTIADWITFGATVVSAIATVISTIVAVWAACKAKKYVKYLTIGKSKIGNGSVIKGG